MLPYVLEIFRQKWLFLSIIFTLLLFNIAITVVNSTYQRPLLADLHTKWSNLRRQVSQTGKPDAMTLYQQGSADLETLKVSIPEKRQFARILSDLLETAEGNSVGVSPINYKPVQIKEEKLLSYQLSFSVDGSYAAVKSFLADLQEHPELVVVNTVSFANGDMYIENVVMNLRITVYLREEV